MSAIPYGRYELYARLANGGMAEIFLARQRGEAGFVRDVVLKRLFAHLAEHPGPLQMFQHEARLMAELSHPNIPQAFDLGYVDGLWYMAMEHVEGIDLASIMLAHQGQPLPLPIALAVVLQAAEGLHHAHERADRNGNPLRIVHRDVTPHNLMINRDGVVKLLDFGIARTALRPDSEPGVIKGTFSYMSPEQIRGKVTDKRSDVFSLGIVLYELTTGERLFSGTDIENMTRIVEFDVPPPSDFVADYPEDLQYIVLAALKRNRGERITSAWHLGAAIDEFARRHGIVLAPRMLARFVQSLEISSPRYPSTPPVGADQDEFAEETASEMPSADSRVPKRAIREITHDSEKTDEASLIELGAVPEEWESTSEVVPPTYRAPIFDESAALAREPATQEVLLTALKAAGAPRREPRFGTPSYSRELERRLTTEDDGDDEK